MDYIDIVEEKLEHIINTCGGARIHEAKTVLGILRMRRQLAESKEKYKPFLDEAILNAERFLTEQVRWR